MTDFRVKATVNALVDRYGEDGSLVVAINSRDAAKQEFHRAFYADVVEYIEAALAKRDSTEG